ncbi:type IV pilin protein [Rhodanobacter sp. L36]|uniref:type IV pilin protein n=1 Tax=Rhodanobacter sp. L36 TaxID=1747221 RepID=UPI00131BB1A7|nr:type IV pilin protein [Rhodanobacter sp. L36]
MERERGFTLVELMVVVLIIAILAAVAIPAYGRYAFRARRGDGQALLLRIANAQERFYATNNHYGSLSDVGFSAPATSEKGFYLATSDVASGSTSAQAFKAKATPQGAQASDACQALSISNAGVKLPAATDTTSNSNGNCW